MRKKSNIKLIFKQFTICVFFFGISASAYATDESIDFTLPASRFYSDEVKLFPIAANESDVVKVNLDNQTTTPAAEFEPPLFSNRKIHQYLGLTTIALAGLTALAAPEACKDANCPPRDVNGTHATLAKATIAMAAATIATGLYAHWNDFQLADGWADPDNLHVLLGVSGAALMAYAVNKSANSTVPVNHAAIAEAGAVLMVVAIKFTW